MRKYEIKTDRVICISLSVRKQFIGADEEVLKL